MPYQQCNKIPKQDCNTVHKKVPKRVSRRVPKKVCDDGQGFNNNVGSSNNNNGGQFGTENVELNNILSVRSSEGSSDAIRFE